MSAVDLLTRAIQFDVDGRKTEALKLYQNGIAQLLQDCKSEQDAERKRHYQLKIDDYMKRAEQLKSSLPAVAGTLVDKMHIMENDTGYDYERVMGKYLTNAVTEVQLEEPYLREHYQLMNLLRFCELLALKCSNLRTIRVTTVRVDRHQNSEQSEAFEAMVKDHQTRRVGLTFSYSDTLHDRQIILNNGYVIKIGRGLNYHKPVPNRFSLGFFDYKLRKCKQCNVDILFSGENRTD